MGRHTYKFFPKVSKNLHITSRKLITFLTNHGPFQNYLYKIGKRSAPMCIYNHLSDSLHYILICLLTQPFHTRRGACLLLQHWFQHVLKSLIFIQKIITCIRVVERVQFCSVGPFHPDSLLMSSSNEDQFRVRLIWPRQQFLTPKYSCEDLRGSIRLTDFIGVDVGEVAMVRDSFASTGRTFIRRYVLPTPRNLDVGEVVLARDSPGITVNPYAGRYVLPISLECMLQMLRCHGIHPQVLGGSWSNVSYQLR